VTGRIVKHLPIGIVTDRSVVLALVDWRAAWRTWPSAM
jgi:hypothetical protein